MCLVVLTGGATWGPPRVTAAILLGPEVLPPPATFDSRMVLVGMLVHCALSLILAMLWGVVARPWSVEVTALVGAGFGVAVYLVILYGAAAMVPWFADARNAATIMSHAVFGIALALGYSMRVRARAAAGGSTEAGRSVRTAP